MKTAVERAEELFNKEKEQNISLLEWIRDNAVEVQGGWQYDGWTYTDKEILEVYYKQFKQQEQ
jgi:glycogen synthase